MGSHLNLRYSSPGTLVGLRLTEDYRRAQGGYTEVPPPSILLSDDFDKELVQRLPDSDPDTQQKVISLL